MSSNGTPGRSHKQTSASTSPPLLPQQQYYSHLPFQAQGQYHFQAPQPFPSYQQPHQVHQPAQIQTHPQLSHPQSPYAQHPSQQLSQHQPMQHPPPLAPQLPSQTQPASPRSRKRKAPGSTPAADMSSLTSSITSSMGTGYDKSGQIKAEGAGEDPALDPPPKKSRTNTPWTAAEENTLRQLKTQGKSWGEIAKSFPNRTEGSVKKHWYKDMHHAEFAEDESQALMNAIKEYEANKWKTIGAKVGKPAKACEQYYKEHFQGRI